MMHVRGTHIKAVGLLSGGLDSTLATRIMLDQGIEVTGIHFFTGFCIAEHRQRVDRKKRKRPVRNEALRAAADLGVKIELVDISSEYLEIITKPRFGYGSAVNPCTDCRIFMLQKTKAHMERIGAHFVFTGEVLGQRPMSQTGGRLRTVERESGLKGYLLRPLSAKLLEPTVPEQKGWVDRDRLYDISGRSRKCQMALAAELGVMDYPSPAGGCCFLTDKNYARKFRDLIARRGEDEELTLDDIMLLKAGRHFRVSENVKVIVGRDEGENRFLERYKEGRWTFDALNYTGPLVLAEGDLSQEEMEQVAAITARYGHGKDEDDVHVKYEKDGEEGIITPKRLDEDLLEQWRI